MTLTFIFDEDIYLVESKRGKLVGDELLCWESANYSDADVLMLYKSIGKEWAHIESCHRFRAREHGSDVSLSHEFLLAEFDEFTLGSVLMSTQDEMGHYKHIDYARADAIQVSYRDGRIRWLELNFRSRGERQTPYEPMPKYYGALLSLWRDCVPNPFVTPITVHGVLELMVELDSPTIMTAFAYALRAKHVEWRANEEEAGLHEYWLTANGGKALRDYDQKKVLDEQEQSIMDFAELYPLCKKPEKTPWARVEDMLLTADLIFSKEVSDGVAQWMCVHAYVVNCYHLFVVQYEDENVRIYFPDGFRPISEDQISNLEYFVAEYSAM